MEETHIDWVMGPELEALRTGNFDAALIANCYGWPIRCWMFRHCYGTAASDGLLQGSSRDRPIRQIAA
jgi:hypothetical protein